MQAQIGWNEVAVVSRHKGRVSTSKCWKRALSVFANPLAFLSPQSWGEAVQPMGQLPWGMWGSGLIVMDFDERRAFCVGDHPVPGQVDLRLTPLDPAYPHVQALISEQANGPCIFIEGDDGGSVTLAQLRLRHSKVELCPEALVVDEQPQEVSRIQYRAPGWSIIQASTAGQLLDVLEDLAASGFPCPHWDGFEGYLAERGVPINFTPATTAPPGSGVGFEVALAEASAEDRSLLQRFEQMRDRWK